MTTDTLAEPSAERSEARFSVTRLFTWSVRRELWEYRAVWIGPAVAAGLVLLGFMVRLFKLPQMLDQVEKLPAFARDAAIAAPFAVAGASIAVTAFVVTLFYCLGALGNERRDRSILFWKSLPVSDTTTVLAKAFIPLVVLPAVAFVLTLATQLIMLSAGSVVLLAGGRSAGVLWAHWPFFSMSIVLLYCLVISTLWYAPIVGWLLMISSWARRVAFLWAFMPWLGLVILERIALDTGYVSNFLGYRIRGWGSEGLSIPHIDKHHMPKELDPLALLAPGHFFATPGLWLGLLAAALFIAAAIWFRRMRDPG
jgi:ABC-2 type transport system permease protein